MLLQRFVFFNNFDAQNGEQLNHLLTHLVGKFVPDKLCLKELQLYFLGLFITHGNLLKTMCTTLAAEVY